MNRNHQQTFISSVYGGIQILGAILGPMSESDRRRQEWAKQVCPETRLGWRGWPGTPSWGYNHTATKHMLGNTVDEKDRCPMWLVVALTAISIGATVVLLNPSLISFLISRL